MARPRLGGLDPRRLRAWLLAIFAALALPTALLVYHAYGQLKWEAFHRQRVLAEEFAARVDARLAALVAAEEARAVGDYAFLVLAGDPAANFLQRSPLAAYPLPATPPGLVGHFQVDADGAFSSPLLPGAGDDAARYGVAGDELAARTAQVERLRAVLGRSRVDEGSAALALGDTGSALATEADDRGAGASAERRAGERESTLAQKAAPAAPAESKQQLAPAQS
ncbi:MAG TPA: sensor histidine kinase, partial [Gammaproteobacteria bacterium]